MKTEITAMPAIRKYVRDEYEKYVSIYTEPTPKGKGILDIFHPFYRVKNLGRGKKVNTFNDEMWAEIEKCADQGLIKLEFRLPWLDNSEDRIFNSLKALYFSPETDEINAEWNLFRNEVLRLAVNDLYEQLQDEICKELRHKAELIIIDKCRKRFAWLIGKMAFKSQEDEPRPRVLAFVPDPHND